MEEERSLLVLARRGDALCVSRLLRLRVCHHENATTSRGNTPLLIAAREGHVDVVDVLLKGGTADVNHVNNDGDSALMLASRRGHARVIKVLVTHGAAIRVRVGNWTPNTVISEAASFGRFSAVKKLLKYTANHLTPSEKMTALTLAAKYGHLAVVKLLLTAGCASENLPVLPPSAISVHGSLRAEVPWVHLSIAVIGKDSVLLSAVRHGHMDIVSLLLQHGADMMHYFYGHPSALQLAMGQPELKKTVEVLIASRQFQTLDPEVKDKVLEFAVTSGSTDMLDMALKAGARVSNHGGAAVLNAAKQGKFQMIKPLVVMGASVHWTDEEGHTALWLAALKGNFEAVQLLVSARNRLHSSKSQSRPDSAVVAAAVSGNIEVVRFIDADNEKLLTKEQLSFSRSEALIMACKEDQYHIVRFFLDLPCLNVNHVNSKGHTPLTRASKNGNMGILKALFEMGADVNGVTNGVQTSALTWAASGGHLETVKTLIEAGAHVNETSTVTFLESPLFAAISNNHCEVAEYLVSHGADIHLTLSMGRSILHDVAKRETNRETIFQVISLGCDVNARDLIGRTPLFIAVCSAAPQQVKALVDAGADVNLGPKCKMSPLKNVITGCNMEVCHAMRTDERLDIARYLLRNPKRIHLTDEYHALVCMNAEWNSCLHADMIRSGAVPSIQGSVQTYRVPSSVEKAGTPFSLAICSRALNTAKFLMGNWFLHEDDVYHFRHREDVKKQLGWPRNEAEGDFMRAMFSKPWTLASLSFVVASTALGMDKLRSERVERLNVPNVIKRKFLFKDASHEIPIEKWRAIDLSIIHGV